jgi:hypothetical protein
MARAISFRGVDAVVEAYELNRIGPWAVISQGKILCSSSDVGDEDIEDGSQQLEGFLEMMKKHGSQAVYELQVYRLGAGNVDINSKTPYCRCIPFSLFENQETGMSNTDNRIVTLLTAMEARLKAIEDREAERLLDLDEEQEEDGTVMGKIGSMAMGFLEQPQVQQAIALGAMNLVKKFVPSMTNSIPVPDEGRKVAGVQAGYVNLLTEEQIVKVHNAVTRLSAKDAELGDHLTKLADIAEREPKKYSMALNFL